MDFEITLAGLVVGILIGLTGIGGGSLLTPALIVVFKTNPLTAVGTDLVFNAATKLFGSVQHGRQRTISYRLAFYLGLGSIPAALAGVGFITLLEDVYNVDASHVVKIILGVTLLLAGGLMIVRPTDVRFFVPFERRSRFTVLLGAVVGFLVGVTSIGSGALIVPMLTLFYPMPINRVVGTDIFHALVLASVASAAHWGAGHVDWTLAGNLLIGSIPGVLLGARLAIIAPDRVMRPALGLLVIFSGIRLL